MKIALTSAALALVATTLSWDVTTGKKLTSFRGDQLAQKKLLANSRRLEDEEEEEEEEEEYAFLQNYQIKFVKCLAGEESYNREGEKEYNSVIYRLCPVEDECSEEEALGCSAGYGDYVTSLSTYLDASIDDDRRRRKLEQDEFRLEEYIECREYDFDEDEDEEDRRRKLDEEYGYFVGPACTEDGSDVRLALFDSNKCKTESEDWESISNGAELPYAEGGVVSPYCEAIYGKNEDGEYEMNDEYMEMYENSKGCETNMEYYDENNGKDESQCEFIEEFVKVSSGNGAAGKVILWIIVILIVIGGIYFYMQYQEKKKNADKKENLVKSEGVSA